MILDLIAVMALVINIFCLSGHCILSINQIVTNTLLTIASSFSAITGIVYIYSKDAKELLGHRILFLHDKGDKLRESYINFINALGFDDDHTKTLYRNSWKLIQPENWPNLDTINQIQHNIRNQSANFTINVQAILVTYNELLYSVKEVANAGSTRIFSRNRDLVESTSLEAYFYISNLWIALDPISRMLEPQNHIQLTLLENQLKDSAFRSGIVLIDLCKFAFRIKPLLKNTTTCQ